MIRAHVLVCGGTGCTSSGSPKIQDAFKSEIEKNGLVEEVKVVQTGCFGLCALGIKRNITSIVIGIFCFYIITG